MNAIPASSLDNNATIWVIGTREEVLASPKVKQWPRGVLAQFRDGAFAWASRPAGSR